MFTTVPFGSVYGQNPYGTAATTPSVGEQRNVNPNVSGGAGLKAIMQASGDYSQGVTGFSLPALLALGIMAWYLFRIY